VLFLMALAQLSHGQLELGRLPLGLLVGKEKHALLAGAGAMEAVED
jgi:hypothetical protein